MRTENSGFEDGSSSSSERSQIYPLVYKHANGQETRYDLQQTRYEDGRTSTYVLSESPDNQGPGFERSGTRDAVAEHAGRAALALNNPQVFPEAKREIRPSEIEMYQQKPEGDFERVSFRAIGRDGRSSVDIEMAQNDPDRVEAYRQEQKEAFPRQPGPQLTEAKRTPYSREEVESATEVKVGAPEQTPQQRYRESHQEQWRDFSGATLNRKSMDPAELKQDAAKVESRTDSSSNRSREQSQQSNQHRDSQYQSQEF